MSKINTFEEVLEKEGTLVYTCKGYSMLPMLRQQRDLVVVSRKREGVIKKYEVILFKRNGKYILHRVLHSEDDNYTTAGDHNWYKEYHVRNHEIIGVLTSFIRDGKEIRTDNIKYQVYMHLISDCFPLRALILRVAGKAKSIIHRFGDKSISE